MSEKWWIETSQKLNEPFPEKDIEWRVQQSGEYGDSVWAMVLAYVTNRAIMERLDDVFGMENWQNHFSTGPGGGIVCAISVRKNDESEWITKEDGASNTEVEAVKGGLSGAMKRAGVQLGIGRYLYKLESNFAKTYGGKDKSAPKGAFKAKTKKGTQFKWSAPELPIWALPPMTAGAKTPKAKVIPAPAKTPVEKSKAKPNTKAEPNTETEKPNNGERLKSILGKANITNQAKFLKAFNVNIKKAKEIDGLFTEKITVGGKEAVKIFLYVKYHTVVSGKVDDFEDYMSKMDPNSDLMISHIEKDAELEKYLAFYKKY